MKWNKTQSLVISYIKESKIMIGNLKFVNIYHKEVGKDEKNGNKYLQIYP